MKQHIILTLLLITYTALHVSAQNVGISTYDPQETLHVAGDVRISTTDQAGVTTTELTGMDGNGTLRDVSVGAHLTLSSNVINAASNLTDYEFGSLTLTAISNDNVDLLMDEGEANFGKQVIRISRSTAGDVEITGIKDGYDGQHLWLYAQNGKMTLKLLDASSSAVNQIQNNDKKAAAQWGMIELVYDGTNALWIIMQHHI